MLDASEFKVVDEQKSKIRLLYALCFFSPFEE